MEPPPSRQAGADFFATFVFGQTLVGIVFAFFDFLTFSDCRAAKPGLRGRQRINFTLAWNPGMAVVAEPKPDSEAGELVIREIGNRRKQNIVRRLLVVQIKGVLPTKNLENSASC